MAEAVGLAEGWLTGPAWTCLVLGSTVMGIVSTVWFGKLEKKPEEKKGAEEEEGRGQNGGDKVWVLVRGRMVLRRKRKPMKEEEETDVEVVSDPGPEVVQGEKEEGLETKVLYCILRSVVRYYCVMALFYQFMNLI